MNGERLVFPEIPCSFDAELPDWTKYLSCVKRSLADLREAGVLEKAAASRFLASALRAFNEASPRPYPRAGGPVPGT